MIFLAASLRSPVRGEQCQPPPADGHPLALGLGDPIHLGVVLPAQLRDRLLELGAVSAQGETHLLLAAQREAINNAAQAVTAVVMSTDSEHNTATLQLDHDAVGAVVSGERVLLQREPAEDSGFSSTLQPKPEEDQH